MERARHLLRILRQERRRWLNWLGEIDAALIRGEIMKDVKNVMRIVGIILLGMFVLVVAIPLVLTAAGVVLAGVGAVIGIAVALIKLAVLVAVGYLILVGIRAVMK
jgi:hypothetical protein